MEGRGESGNILKLKVVLKHPENRHLGGVSRRGFFFAFLLHVCSLLLKATLHLIQFRRKGEVEVGVKTSHLIFNQVEKLRKRSGRG